MTTGPERGLREWYADPERADFELWGRRAAGTDRRGFLKGAGLAAMERCLRAGVPMARHMPAGRQKSLNRSTIEACMFSADLLPPWFARTR